MGLFPATRQVDFDAVIIMMWLKLSRKYLVLSNNA